MSDSKKKSSQLAYWRAIARQRDAENSGAAHAADTGSAKHAADQGTQRNRKQKAGVFTATSGTALHSAAQKSFVRSSAPSDIYCEKEIPAPDRSLYDMTPEFSMPQTFAQKQKNMSLRSWALCAVAGIVILVLAGKCLLSNVNQDYTYHVSDAMIVSSLNEGSKELDVVSSSVQMALDSQLAYLSTEERLARKETMELQLLDIDSLSGQEEPFTFTLNTQSSSKAPVFSDEALQTLTQALSALPQDTKAGYLLLDIASGRGFAGNIDAKIYGASTFKVFFVAYVLEQLVDTGQVDLFSVRRLMQMTIVESDNDAYIMLRERYNIGDGFADYLASIGVSADLASEDYPTYSVRESAKLWLYVYTYLQTDTQGAEFLTSMLSTTSTSFIRAEIAAPNVTIMSKAGWIESDSPEYNSTSDAGIVNVNDRDYLLCFMSDVPCTDENSLLAQQVILAIYQARDNLV